MIWLHFVLSLCVGLTVGIWAYRVERSVLIATACGLFAATWLQGQFGSVQF